MGIQVLRALDPCATGLPLDTDAGVPGFGDPVHAQAFGTSMALARAGVFTWETWVSRFSAEIRDNPQQPGESSEAAYYRQWLAALESLVAETGSASKTEIDDTVEHWRRSYLNTPHGKPIELSRSWPAVHDHHDHDHHDHHDHGHHHSGHHHHHHGDGTRRQEPVTVDFPRHR